MKVAITHHAVERFMERVEGASKFEKESIRSIIQYLVEQGFTERVVSRNPTYGDRRVVPFKSGGSILYLSLAPNTTAHTGEVAVVSVLYEHEISDGKVGLGVTLGDIAPEIGNMEPVIQEYQYMVYIGSEDSIERYKIKDTNALEEFLKVKKPEDGRIYLYENCPDIWDKILRNTD
jgi:hypothetical protein